MIRYGYNQQMQPPAPFVYVTIQNPADGSIVRDIPAQVDTAADRSVFPDTLVQGLALSQMGVVLVGGLGGVTHTLPLYAVFLGIHDLPLQPFKVIASEGEAWVLLGRDVVNAHRLVLDGPQLGLEVS